MTDSIAVAKLVVYVILLQPALYCLWKHGKTGFLGWFYVQLFCILRIATGGIGLGGSSTGISGVVVSSIGLSPLLLAVAGVLHEARRATNPCLNRKLELFLDIQYHAFVGAGMALIIVAVVNLMQDQSVSTMKVLLDVGSAISATSWCLLLLWAIWSLSTTAHGAPAYGDSTTIYGGRELLNAVFIALVCIALRIAYAIAFLQLRVSNPSSDFLTNKAAEVCLSVVPEMLCIANLLYAGIRTTGLRNELKRRDQGLANERATEMK